MQIGVGCVQNLVYPVNQLDVRVTPHLAENRCAFDRLVSETVEFSEKGCALDLCHK